MRGMIRLLVLLALGFSTGACSTTPGATELPEPGPAESGREEAMSVPVEVPVVREPEAATAPSPADPPAPNYPYEKLEYKGVRGGRIRFEVAGTPDDVLAMLLDFDHAAGHRAWAKTYTALPDDGTRRLARWDFEGEAGINPSVDLEFTERRNEKGITLRYKLARTEFGLAAFFGAYEIRPTSESLRSQLTETVFIDSGTWLANASEEEIEAGLREDAKLIVEWMDLRTKR